MGLPHERGEVRQAQVQGEKTEGGSAISLDIRLGERLSFSGLQCEVSNRRTDD